MAEKKTLRIARTALFLGLFALAGWAALMAQERVFQFRGPLARVITPNGDGKNDLAIFCVDNFAQSGVTGRIFTVLGSEVADMPLQNPALAGCPPGDLPMSLTWDARSNGALVPSGIYVYQVESEGLVFTGSLLVVR